MQGRVRVRHGTLNRHLKNLRILSQVFRHHIRLLKIEIPGLPPPHIPARQCVKVVCDGCGDTHLTIENGEPLFDVEYCQSLGAGANTDTATYNTNKDKHRHCRKSPE